MRGLMIIIITGLIAVLLVGCAASNIDTSEIEKEQYREVKSIQTSRQAPAEEEPAAEEAEELEVEEMPNEYVIIKTSKGDIELALNLKHAPITVENFLTYVDEGFYDGTVFHRVIDGFMIQGGGFTPDGNKKQTHAPIKLESQNGLMNKRGTIAMARTNVPDSATSQFFINVVDNAMLDYRPGNDGYAVFGKVVAGMDVVDAIKGVATSTKNGMGDWPVEDVVIEKIERKN